MAQTSSQPERVPAHLNASREICTGRQGEMAELESALAEAFAGTGQLVMVSGAPGIGKKRTVQKLEAKALLDGSLAISSELWMKPIMNRVLSRREALGLRDFD